MYKCMILPHQIMLPSAFFESYNKNEKMKTSITHPHRVSSEDLDYGHSFFFLVFKYNLFMTVLKHHI